MRSIFRTSLLLVAGFILLGSSRAAAADHSVEALRLAAGHAAAAHSPQPFATLGAATDTDDDTDVDSDSPRTGKVAASASPCVTPTVHVLRVSHHRCAFTSDPSTCHALLRAPPVSSASAA